MPEVKAPKSRKPEYDIRTDKNWTEVYNKLENAREHYTNQTGIRGGIRRAWKWAADNTEPVLIRTGKKS